MVPQNIWNKLLPSLYLNRHCDKSSLCPSCRIKAFSGQIPLKLLLWFNRQIMTDRQSYFRNKLKWMVLYNLKETKYPVKVIISRFQKRENYYNRFFDNEYLLPYPLWLFPIIFCLIKNNNAQSLQNSWADDGRNISYFKEYLFKVQWI